MACSRKYHVAVPVCEQPAVHQGQGAPEDRHPDTPSPANQSSAVDIAQDRNVCVSAQTPSFVIIMR